MENIISKIINYLNNQNWPKNKKIRYAYLELGKHIHLNAKFFYSLYKLLDEETKYSLQELRDIYSSLKPSYQVICRDCAIMLKMIFDGCGIESEIKETCEVDHYNIDGGIFDIQHFFLCVTGDNDKKYFLSLALDLPYIQMGMQTEHFATNVVYKNYAGEQVYQGKEIRNTIMPKSDIRKIDEELGYLSFEVNNKKEYFNESFNMLKEANQKYKEYFYRLATNEDNKFYMGLIKVMSDEEDSLSVKLSSISDEKWNEIKKYICTSIKQKINNELYLFNDDFDKGLENLLEEKEYEKYLHILNKVLKRNKKDIEKNSEFSLFGLITNANKLMDIIDKLSKETEYNSEEYLKFKNLLNIYLLKIAMVFIDKKYQPTYDNKFSNEYIANKIKILFPDIFDFNHNTDFTNLGIGEKNKIIDRVMNSIFPELSKDKTIKRKVENPVENRIKTCMIYDKDDEEYKLLINIEVTDEENNKVFIYNFNNDKNYFENIDEDFSILDMMVHKEKYIFLSKSLEIRAQENIESKKRR